MDNKQLRQTAFITNINDLKSGKYIKEDGWEPNYVLTRKAKVSRANLMGVIISKTDSSEGNFRNVVVDDGSGSINVRSFDEGDVFNDIKIGDAVVIIGRPREYGGEKYVLPEIIKKISEKKWLLYRKKELDLFNIKNGDNLIEETAPEDVIEEKIMKEESAKESAADRIINFIRKNDGGEGVGVDDIITHMNNPESENTIQFLLRQGEIFELKPGKVKVLE